MKNRILLVCLLPLLILSGWIVSRVATAQSDTSANNTAINDKASPTAQGFVMFRNAQGEVSCRAATASELNQFMQRRGDSHLIYAGAPSLDASSGKDLNPNLPGGVQSPNLQPSAGLRIILHGTASLDSNSAAKNAFIAAANHWEALISTPITVVLDVDFGPTFFGDSYDDPNILGATATADDTRLYSHHGEPFHDPNEVHRSSQVRHHFHAYATAYVVRRAAMTVALTTVAKGEARKMSFNASRSRPDRSGSRCVPVLLDRGFYSVAVIRYTQARYPFLMLR